MAVTEALLKFLDEPRNVVVVVVCCTIAAMIRQRVKKSKGLPLPPGPKGNWLFGYPIPKAFAYRHFEELTKEYGPMFTIRQGFENVIVIGRMQAAIDIMEKEGAALVDRPTSISAGETLSGGMRMVLTPAGERFKKMRRALHSHLQPKVVHSYSPVFMKNARQHILDILEDPIHHQDHAKCYSASVVMYLAYGKSPKGRDDPNIDAVNRCLTRLGINLRPGLWKVDHYPWLRYIPGYLDELKEGHREELNLFKTQLSLVKQSIERGEEVAQSFGKYLLERQAELDLSDDETAYLAGSMFGAGSDTTASAISVAIMAAACYPEAQRAVQEELDQVLGSVRPPAPEDEGNLPQTMAFVLETMRWRPVTAGGFPHKATKDIVWGEYVIPNGTTVMGNVWAVGRDPEFFPDPETFNPQRWITEDGRLRDDLRSYPFGFGRRVCPGQHMATASIFLNTALTQWAFTIKADPTAPIDTLAFTESANAHPEPFKVIFEPRAAKTLEGIRELIEDYGL